MTALRLLLTGFGPFGRVARNASGEAVTELAHRYREAAADVDAWEHVEALVLPVAYRRAVPLESRSFQSWAGVHYKL